jgi:hypothetical protein
MDPQLLVELQIYVSPPGFPGPYEIQVEPPVPAAPTEKETVAPAVSTAFVFEEYAPPPPPPPPTQQPVAPPAPAPPPPPITSIVLLVLFQSAGTDHVEPLVR